MDTESGTVLCYPSPLKSKNTKAQRDSWALGIDLVVKTTVVLYESNPVRQ